MTKHQIENICWKEVVWHRPYRLETVWETLSHLAALSPRGSIVWEIRSQNGKISYLLGADYKYIQSIEDALKAHGDIQCHDIALNRRMPVSTARQLKITHPLLSLKTDITEAVVRAGLAALVEKKDNSETVIQLILGRAYSPSPVQANLPDPHATFLQVILGDVQKAGKP